MSGPGQFVFDQGRCTGCEACAMACRMANRTGALGAWRRVHTFNRARHPDLPVVHLSLACHHCEDPACLWHCPAGAYARDPGTGAVVLRPERCMGCRYCTWACPHDAPRFAPAQGTVSKCTFCLDRQEQGLEPACVTACPVDALGLEPRTTALPIQLPAGFPPSDLSPSIRIIPGRRPPPALTAPPDLGGLARCREALLAVPEPRITARGEWALVVFTTILAVLAAVMGTAAAGVGALLPRPLPHPRFLLGAGAFALALSTWHLGRPFRAWRALTNLKRSWVSREVALVLAFLGLTGLSLLRFPGQPGLAWAAAAAGFATLFAVDRVYQVAVQAGPLSFHSGHALFNGLFLAGLLAGYWPLALGAGGLKALLYLVRKAHFRRKGRAGRLAFSLLRLLLGFGLPALAFGTWAAVAGAILGDLLDRCEFYSELEIPSPALRLAQDLAAYF